MRSVLPQEMAFYEERGIAVYFNETAYCDEDCYHWWAENVFREELTRTDGTVNPDEAHLLLLDNHYAHHHEAALDFLEQECNVCGYTHARAQCIALLLCSKCFAQTVSRFGYGAGTLHWQPVDAGIGARAKMNTTVARAVFLHLESGVYWCLLGFA